MYADVLVAPEGRVLSHPAGDMLYYHAQRVFGVTELRGGNLPLWNPYVFSGAHFLGGFQTGILYPPTWSGLILPAGRALNVQVALHVFLFGLFTFAWARGRKLDVLSALTTASLAMFCAPHALRVFGGQFAFLSAVAWSPAVFLLADRWLAGRWRLELAAGMAAVAMQTLAGYPQVVYYTAIAVTVYIAFHLPRSRHRLATVAALAASYAGAFLLTSVQILAAMDAAAESTRSGGLAPEAARVFALAPECLAACLTPWLFGRNPIPVGAVPHAGDYWGPYFPWEMIPYFGIVGLALAVWGALRLPRHARVALPGTIAVLLVLAVGHHTPLYEALFRWFPGYDRFRGTGKFLFPAVTLMTLLSGLGLRSLASDAGRRRAFGMGCVAAALLLGAGAARLDASASAGLHGSWAGWIAAVTDRASGYDSRILASARGDASFVHAAGAQAAAGLARGAALLAVLGLLFLVRRVARVAVPAAAVLAILEIFAFARSARPTMQMPPTEPPGVLRDFEASHPDERVLFVGTDSYAGMRWRVPEIWSYDSNLSKRYAELMAMTQNETPRRIPYVPLRGYNPLYRMLRCGTAAIRENGDFHFQRFGDPAPRVLLVGGFTVPGNGTGVLRALADPSFDPEETVILESVPDPAPAPGAPRGTARVVDSGTDHLEVDVTTAAPALLLVTDGYSAGWRARGIGTGPQDAYEVLPADHVLRATPLRAGTHRIRFEFSPDGFRRGRAISLVSLAAYALALGALGWRRRRRRHRTG